MPPRVLASGPKFCGGNNIFIFIQNGHGNEFSKLICLVLYAVQVFLSVSIGKVMLM